jgi:hypothetical protein
MGDDERSFISLQEKESAEEADEEADEESNEEEEEQRDDSQPHSVQNTTSESGSYDEDVVAGSRPDTEDDVSESVVGDMSMKDITVPISLIVAGNILVITVLALFDETAVMRMVAMGFACIEVLVGAALWYVHGR